MDKLRLMKNFVMVVRAGSFLSAASQLNVSRSLLSKHINQLEAQLSVQLLIRDTHGMSLTELGAEYYQFCLQFLEELEEVETTITGRDREPRGMLRVLAPICFGSRFLGPLIADFSDAYPDLEVGLTLWGQPLQSSDVVGQAFDLVVRTIPPLDSSLIVRKVAPVRNVVCASPEYLKRHGEPLTPSDLTQHPCLYHRKGPDHHWRFAQSGNSESVRLPAAKAPLTNSLDILNFMTLQGRGVGILAEYAVYQDILSGKLCELLPEYEVEERGLYLLFPDIQFRPLKVRLFIDYFVERFRRAPWVNLPDDGNPLAAPPRAPRNGKAARELRPTAVTS